MPADGKDSRTAIIVAVIAAGATIAAAMLGSSRTTPSPTPTTATSISSDSSAPPITIAFDKRWEGSMWRAIDKKDNRNLYVTFYRIDSQSVLTGQLRVVIENPDQSCWELYEFNAAPTDNSEELNVEVAPIRTSCGGLGAIRQSLRSTKHGTVRVESNDFLRLDINGIPSIIDAGLVFGRSNENGDILR